MKFQETKTIENIEVSATVCSNAEKFLDLLYHRVNYTIVSEEKVSENGIISFIFAVIGGYVIDNIGDGFVQYYTNFRNGSNYYSGFIPCDYTELPEELVCVL